MKKPTKKPEFLCMSPWTHTYMSPISERRLCCASREPAQGFKQYIDTSSGTNKYKPLELNEWWNGEHIRRVRRQMMSGEIPPECEVCNHKLLNTDVYRDYFWHLFQHRYDEIWETTDESGATTMPVRSWDYRFSNLCNFKCRMCGDMLSSSWEAELKKHKMYNTNDPNNDWTKEPLRSQIRDWQEHATEEEFGSAVENKSVEEIYWVGGEPLMYEQHWRYMNRIIELGYSDRVYARYNTNLSRTSYKTHNLWKILDQFRDWQICASIDGIETRGEFIRSGLNYKSWLANIKEGITHTRHAGQLKLDFTLTTPGLLEIKNIVNLSKELNLPLLAKVTFAFSPDIIMCPLALPRDLLDSIIDENLDWCNKNATTNQQALIDLLVNLKSRPVFAEQWNDTYKEKLVGAKQFMKDLDRIRSGPTMEDVLTDDIHLLNWWNNI